MCKVCIKCGIEKELDNFYTDKLSRDGRHHKCKECHKKMNTEWRESNRDRHRELSRKRGKEKRDELNAWHKEYWRKDLENNRLKAKLHAIKKRSEMSEEQIKIFNSKRRTYVQENKEVYSKHFAKYRAKNYAKIRLSSTKRRAGLLQRTPSWADQDKIKEVYMNCPKGLAVDHVIPLHGKTVSGLHVHYNLQYLTKEENSRKGNRL